MKIVYTGIEGSFSYITAKRLFDTAELKGLPTFREAYEALETGEADLGVFPVRNTLVGPITESLEHLVNLEVIQETRTPVVLCLMGLPGAKIKKVLSYHRALSQCLKFFAKHPEWEATPHYDTAGAAADVAKWQDPTLAAIAPALAAKTYGLEILAEGIQDQDENYTYFAVAKKRTQ